MALVREIGFEECAELLRGGVIGRAALSTPTGPHIVPVNYSVVDEALLVATTPYSVLGTYGRGSMVAFEVDDFDYETHWGWSVVARGRAELLGPDEVQRIKAQWSPHPWADGSRTMHLRIPWQELSGRRVGSYAAPPRRPTAGIA
jgi:nitroimidazol reductase NimA-like FMN-containing flavoprotein (pyridoxamine 5'-phosphate oxidase superfamily)